MVVLQLGPYPPPHGGVQTNLVAIREHLRQHRMSAPVINLTRHRRSDADDVYYPRSALEVLRLLVTVHADIIHLHIGGQLSSRLLGLCLASTLIPGRRVVLTFHSGGYPSWSRGRAVSSLSFRGFVFRRLDAIIAVNEEIAALFRRFGVPSDRIHVICPYAPARVDDASDIPSEVRRFRESHSTLLTTVGLLEPEYDLPLQIGALAGVRRLFPKAGLVIIGSGSLEPELRRLIAASPQASHVLLCGDVPHQQTLAVLAASDVFLRTTMYDGDSVSVREALQLGVPVIATDNGMRPAGVRLIPHSDTRALEGAIADVFDHPLPRASVESAGVRSQEEVLSLYATVLGRPTASFCRTA